MNRMTYPGFVLLIASAAPLATLAQEPNTESSQYWAMSASSFTPEINGNRVELVDDNTIRLSASTPPGWTLEFTAESQFVSGEFYHSNNTSGQISAAVDGPNIACTVLAGAEDGKQAQMNFIMPADGVPQGIALVYGTCFDAPFPGVNLNIPFGSRPGH
jgi:hypothetical protein